MKAMALYLPAFHQVPINDKWWGEGFTEWDNVRSGEAFFPRHIQPVHPYKYYDLSKVEDIRRQISLANKYNVAGFIMHHYWFPEKDQIFSKPAEIIRDEIKDDIEYCFCWANESWVTTWHGNEPSTILKQTYGPESEWLAHIKYLKTFFDDSRYSRINSRPVLYIYKPNEIPNYEKMIDFWNNYLEQHGEKPIYIVEYICSKNTCLSSKKSDAVVEFEPLNTTFFDLGIFNKARRAFCKITKQIDFQSYDKLWNAILKRKRTYEGKPIIRGCFVAWDNSPRKERNSMIVQGSTPEKFESYLRQLVHMHRKDVSEELIVINAWNEWSEGAFLEPSEENGFKYLEAVKRVFDELEGTK
nr:glycoside hydrolase family 99-like domain-containing protein [uncultured Lachnoclostridium sp.]